MLSELYIQNIAVIQKTAMEFESGFNILTGETGAGKTILINAINAVLGERTSKDIIRAGEEKAHVSALFTQVPKKTADKIQALGYEVESDDSVLITRDIFATAKTICRINGKPATVSILKEIASEMINIHGQHDNQKLLNPENHIHFIDSFGELYPKITAYHTQYQKLLKVYRELKSVDINEEEKKEKMEQLSYQIEEITSAQLKIGEEEELVEQRNQIKNASKITQSLSMAYECLHGNDEKEGVLSVFDDLTHCMGEASHYITKLEEATKQFTNMQYELQEYAGEIRSCIDELEFNPNQLEEVEQRLDQIYKLKKKYGNSIEEILSFLENIQTELDTICFSGQVVEKLQQAYEENLALAREMAAALSKKRMVSAKKLVAELEKELAFLDMPNVKLVIEHTEKKLSAIGYDQIEFLIVTNAGETPKPLGKIASGGEISRIMLALKNVMADKEDVTTLIFDEIDTGVSGRAAQKIGVKLQEVAQGRQVICISHLAQVACHANCHFLIQKSTEQSKTFTEIFKLNRADRLQELARITSGETITEIALQNADELLKSAGN